MMNSYLTYRVDVDAKHSLRNFEFELFEYLKVKKMKQLNLWKYHKKKMKEIN